MKKLSSLTIGIPALNEEANISHLLKNLLSQNQKSFNLQSIIVFSDGSSDDTALEARKIKSKKIKVLESKNRLGKAVIQNKILAKVNSEIAVLIDADVSIKDKNFLEKLINPIINNHADLTSASVAETTPQNYLEKILKLSMDFKRAVFEDYKNGNNIYTCHGRARAFSKKLYQKIKFKDSIGEDAYSYLYTSANGLKYQFVKNTKVFYKLPETLSDHEKQSIRFYKSPQKLKEEFGQEFVLSQYKLPKVRSLIAAAKFGIKNPAIISYFALAVLLKLRANFINIDDLWETSHSSKSVLGKKIPTLSVIIPTCYGGGSLVKAVKSIRISDPKNEIKIIIVADTIPLSASIKNQLHKMKVKVIENKIRGGQFKKVKQGLNLTNTDIVTFAQDDVVFEKDALQQIQKYFLKNPETTMVSINDTPFKAENLVEAAVNVGYRISHRIRKSWNNGQNYILACGRALSFKTKAAKKFTIPDDIVNGDAYLYFENKRLGGKFNFCKDAVVYYRNPSTFGEHLKKSSRYQDSSVELKMYFGKKISPELVMPKDLMLKGAIKEFLSNPLPFMFYVPLVLYTRFFKMKQKENLNSLWDVELSTKK